MVYCHSIYKNIYSLSDRNIILFRLSPVRLNLLLVKSIPSVLKILSAVVEVATTHKYFLAKFTRWGNLYILLPELKRVPIFGSFLYLAISSIMSCFTSDTVSPSSEEELVLNWAQRILLFFVGGSTILVVLLISSCDCLDIASSAIASQTPSLSSLHFSEFWTLDQKLRPFQGDTVNHDDTLEYKRLIGYNTINC